MLESCVKINVLFTFQILKHPAGQGNESRQGEANLKTVFVVGAGRAGMFAAQKIDLGGHNVVIFNRDIKPGGLAEYGIYRTKDKMQTALRKPFANVQDLANV